MSSSRRAGRRIRRLESLGAMAAGLAHEIKNPLSTMSLNLQLMEEDFREPGTPTEERTLKRARLLLGEVQRLNSIVNDFLELARGFELRAEAVDLELLLTELLRFVEPENDRLGVTARTSLQADARHVVADPKFLRVAIMNLVINAQQAMGEDGGDLIIETRARDPFVEIRVTDTGPGIPPDKLDKIFMPFWSTKADGTGIGLPMTRRIVEELGGEMAVQSAVGHGTRFVVSVPKLPLALPDGSESTP